MKTCKRGLHLYAGPRCAECRRLTAAAWRAANPEKHRARASAWRLANPDRHRARCAAWVAANTDRKRAKDAAWRATNSRRVREKVAAWRAANPEKQRACEIAWQKANPERRREMLRTARRLRRARKKGSVVVRFKAGQRAAILTFYGCCCAYCGVPIAGSNLHWDHVVPIARGGAEAPHNVVPACAACNQKKHANTWEPRARHPWMALAVQNVVGDHTKGGGDGKHVE